MLYIDNLLLIKYLSSLVQIKKILTNICLFLFFIYYFNKGEVKYKKMCLFVNKNKRNFMFSKFKK